MEPLIDPLTGGLKFIDNSNISEDNNKKNLNINNLYEPKQSKYFLRKSTRAIKLI